MSSTLVFRVIAYAVIPLVMAGIGNNLAAKEEEPRRRKMYKLVFVMSVILGIAVTCFVESYAEKSHNTELQKAEGNYKDLKSDNDGLRNRMEASLQNESHMRGQLETLAAVYSHISSGGDLARALAAVSKNAAKSPTERHAEAQVLLGNLLAEGVKLTQDGCLSEKYKTTVTPQLAEPFERWEERVIAAVAGNLDPSLLREWYGLNISLSNSEEKYTAKLRCVITQSHVWDLQKIMAESFGYKKP